MGKKVSQALIDLQRQYAEDTFGTLELSREDRIRARAAYWIARARRGIEEGELWTRTRKRDDRNA